MGKLLAFLAGVVVTVAIVLVTAPQFLRHRGDLPLERIIAEVAKEAAIPGDAKNLQPPRPINDRRAINQGREAYTGACATCHGATGDGRGVFGQAMYPDATDLRAHDTQEKTDGQLFWIIQNGLSFGGMPAFSDKFTDETIWSLVGYTRALASPGTTAPAPIAVPTPSADDLALADPHSSSPNQRGAALYYAHACSDCHGPRGNAPGDLAIGPPRKSMRSFEEFSDMLSKPDAAMPRNSAQELTTSERQDLFAFVQSLPPVVKERRATSS